MALVDGALCLTTDARGVLEILSWLPWGTERQVFDAWEGEDSVLVGRLLLSLEVIGLVKRGVDGRGGQTWSLTACGRLVVDSSDEIGDPKFTAADGAVQSGQS